MSGLFSTNRIDLRRLYLECWQKYEDKKILSPLETQVVDIILQHPEYHQLLTETQLAKDYLPELGETNPFLHMSLHMALQEQISTDRPTGIRAIYQMLCQQLSAHEVEHKMFEILAETLWQAQRDNKEPDENQYLEKLRKLLI
jgi:hypothetical protein